MYSYYTTLKKRKLKHRDLNNLRKVTQANSWQSWDSNPKILALRPTSCHSTLLLMLTLYSVGQVWALYTGVREGGQAGNSKLREFQQTPWMLDYWLPWCIQARWSVA